MAQAHDSEPEVCQPPDPNPLRPLTAVPAGAWDCHAHVYGPAARYPYKAKPRYEPAPGGGFDDYSHMLSTLGIQYAVIVQPNIYTDNRLTMDVLEAAGGRWRGIALLKANTTVGEVRSLHELGFRGVRFNGRGGAAGLTDLDAVAKLIAPFGWHIQVHLYGRDLPELVPLLARLPVDVVIDHFGRLPTAEGVRSQPFQSLLGLLAKGRCWVKLSAPNRFSDPKPPYASLAPFAHELIAAAPDHMLWGTDWPHSSHMGYMPNDAELIDLLAQWAPDDARRHAILVNNPARLYGVPD